MCGAMVGNTNASRRLRGNAMIAEQKLTREPGALPDGPDTHAFKDAGIAALIAFGLFLPLIGFHAVPNIRNELVLETRFRLLAGLIAAVAAGRLFYNLVIAPWRERRLERAAVAAESGAGGSRFPRLA